MTPMRGKPLFLLYSFMKAPWSLLLQIFVLLELVCIYCCICCMRQGRERERDHHTATTSQQQHAQVTVMVASGNSEAPVHGAKDLGEARGVVPRVANRRSVPDTVAAVVLFTASTILLSLFLWVGVACRLFHDHEEDVSWPNPLPLCEGYLQWEARHYHYLAPASSVCVTFVFVVVNWMALKFYRTN